MQYSRYFAIARNHRRLLFIGVSAGLVAGLASGFGVPFFVEQVFRKIFEDSERAYSLNHLILVASLLPGVFLVRGIASYINQYFLQWTVQNVLLEIRQQLFGKLQSLPIAYFEKRQSGDLMAKLVGDTLQVQQSILIVARDLFVQPFTFLAGLGYLVYLSVSQKQVGFLLLLVVLAPIIVLPVRYIGKHLQRRSRDLQQTLGELTDIMAENLRGVVEVRSFNLENREKTRFMVKLKAYNRFAMKMAKYYHINQPFMELLAVTMVSVGFVYSYQEGVGFSAFAAMGAALFFSVDAVKRLVKMLNGLQKTSGSFERIETVLAEEETVRDVEHPVTLTTPAGNLRFEKLRFSYTESERSPDLSVDALDIPLGTVCALVGPSGAGKSTFAKLIPRFYDPQVGRILFDDVDIRHIRKDELRQWIAFVPQAPVLFNGSIHENILLARPDARPEEVRDAARQANAEAFILSLPEGYESKVGENAVRLSGGQRQRLALARAILKNAPILLLDEATSALDAESEEKVQEALKLLSRNRTIIIIAHRFATIRMANKILLFENGRIRCSGDLETLMRDELFRRLNEIQLVSH
ncbi:MAG TPA: ABC transporter ATP-binding protein [Oceanipulchritudo sp.]|nr:ABC transporter ATP-binding protein [Oceanipulchritudo sp.]